MPARPVKPRTLGLGPLIAVMFFIVSGGPFGLEGLVGSGGPALALLLREGGYYQWVKRAFGRFWGFWNGWLSWVYSILDMAIYPVLLIQYLHYFVPDLTKLESWLIACAMIWGATWINLRGTRVVGSASGAFVGLVLAPFAVLSTIALARWLSGGAITPLLAPPAQLPGASLLGALGIGVSQAIWNYSGWDNASTVSGEIEHATSAYPKALFRTLPFVAAVYLAAVVPVLAVTETSAWTDGAWPRLAASLA